MIHIYKIEMNWDADLCRYAGVLGEGVDHLWVIDANYYLEGWITTRSYCGAQGTIFSVP